MTPGDPRPLLDRHAARILTRWREQLRSLPPSSALATPELLTPLMAPALARVRHESVQNVPRADRPVGAADPGDCRCGLNPLAAFYLTGECATFEVLWTLPDALAPLAPGDRETLCQNLRSAWRRVATSETAVFCSLCQRGAARQEARAHRSAGSPVQATDSRIKEVNASAVSIQSKAE